jgi:hypothetical protein
LNWQSGDDIVLRYREAGTLLWTVPVCVVEDSPECIAVYLAVDTPIKCPVRLDGTPIPRALPFEERFRLPKHIGDGVWHTTSRLMLARPGAAHLVSLFWDGADGSFLGWYADLQAPFARTPLGFDSEDQVLNILIEADLSWRWKDEDEFADAQRIRRFSTTEAAAIRAEADHVIGIIEARAWPFHHGWEDWTPDPSWPIPALPPGWDAEY